MSVLALVTPATVWEKFKCSWKQEQLLGNSGKIFLKIICIQILCNIYFPHTVIPKNSYTKNFFFIKWNTLSSFPKHRACPHKCVLCVFGNNVCLSLLQVLLTQKRHPGTMYSILNRVACWYSYTFPTTLVPPFGRMKSIFPSQVSSHERTATKHSTAR